MLLLLPAAWRWLEARIVGIVVTLTSFGATAAPELPEAVFQNPLEALPELTGDDAFLAGCAATLAVSMPPASRSHLDWSRWLHERDLGRRAPRARRAHPWRREAHLGARRAQAQERVVAGRQEALGRHVGRGRNSGRASGSSTLRACIASPRAARARAAASRILSAMANFEQGRSLVITHQGRAQGLP